MLRRRDHVSYESLISGLGIANLYDFYHEHLGMKESPDIREQMRSGLDRTPIIFAGAFAETPCSLCRKVVDLFLAILGAEAGNLALKLYARGGIYLGGGILPRIVGKASFDGFLANFRAKGKMSDLMKTIPVQLIMKKDAALMGVARFGHQMIIG
jgi:glucokinase